MNKEIEEGITKTLKELMKSRKTKKIIYKGIYTSYDRQILE